ncbi:hypothetical protein [Nocardia goodfellowii]|uniref:Mycothiol-dependent maleylpyruvate isomerase metal-binding domain-containing protein n=1 Tax=Nocardia goodfellowii TaxID=882446 RepID=A0ABS4QEP2_9NOCA|nr:hypothetical protein [Nocardia goodfellowii]MBP2190177.1 hypothetical protein [Nocardia goodfellowii]
MSGIATAQVVHGLSALSEEDILFGQCWPSIARVVLAHGFSWTALADLVAMDGGDDSALDTKLTELHNQIDRYLEKSPRLDPWDVVAGIYGRAWRMKLIDPISAMWRMDNLWWQIRDLDYDNRDGLRIIWAGMGVKEQDIVDLPRQAVESLGTDVLTKADLLLPPDAVDRQLCKTIRDALEANGY